MEFYFLKSAACLAILMLFYKLMLEKENMHVFKRFYLLFAVLVSLVIPFIIFTTYIEALPQQTVQIVQTSYEGKGEMPEQNINYWPYVLWSIYGLGVLFFSIIFIRNLRELFLKISRNPKQEAADVVLVLLEEEAAPHTFWNYIILNKQKFLERSIPQEVLEHERVHARQKHSIDVLFMELLQIIFWFNPLIYFVKNAVKLNHEFLADQAVISKGVNTSRYQQTLLAFSSSVTGSNLANSISYSSIKKRFTVMKRTRSRRVILIRSMLVLPMLAGLVYGFSTTEMVQIPETERTGTAGTVQVDPVQKEVDANMLEEYDSLVRHYNSMGDNAILKLRDLERMDVIFKLMTPKQKQQAIPRKFRAAPPPIPGEWTEEKKATPQMIKEYNKLARHYSQEQRLSKPGLYNYLRMRHIHSLMTDMQKKDAEPLPDLLPLAQHTPQDSNSGTEQKKSVPADENLVITEDINVHILKDGNLEVNDKRIKTGGLGKRLGEINTYLSAEHQKSASVVVWVEPEVPMEQTRKVEQILRSHGLSQIKIILKSLIDVPESDYFHHFEEPMRTGIFEIRNFDSFFHGSDN